MMKTRAILGVAIAIALAVVGCGGTDKSGSSDHAGGFLRLGDAGSKIDTLNPWVSQNFFGAMTFRYVYPHLLQYDAEGKEIVGELADDFRVGDDGVTWTYDLARDAKWSDGQPLTSDDVVWTMETTLKYKDGPTALGYGLEANVASIKAPNESQVVIRFKKPASDDQSLLSYFPILPKHIWSQHVGTDGKGLTTWKNPAPLVSGGPFILEKYTPDVSMIFRRNPTYHGTKPHIEGFGLQFLGSHDAMVSALKQGQLDIGLEVPPLTVKTLESDPSLTVATPAGPGQNAIIVNSNPNKPDHKELQIPEVRQAMSMAIDREKLVEVVTDGQGVVATTLVPPTVPKWTGQDKLPPFPRDVAGANALLDRLGFKRGPDGIRVANGSKMSYDFNYCPCYGDRPQVIIKESLADIGIGVTVKSADPEAFFAAFTAPDNKALDYDFGMFDAQAQPDPSPILSNLTCSQQGNSNFARFCDEHYDELYREQARELDNDKRLELVVEMQRYIREKAPWMPLYDQSSPVAWRNNVKDFRPSGNIIDTLSTAQFTDVQLEGK